VKVRVRPLLLAAALLLGTAVPLTAPAAADTASVPLGLAALGRIVVDEAHGRVYASGGPSGPGVKVTDLAGAPVTTLQFEGATGMALSPDGDVLWLAQPTMGLVGIDTTTLVPTQRWPLPTDQCAGDVAAVGTRLVYGYSCYQYSSAAGSRGGIGVLDAATGASYGTVTTGPSYQPMLAAGPAGRVYAADAGLSPATLYLYDVSGPSPALIGARADVCGNLRDLAASPDGSQVVTSCGSPYQHTAYSAVKLEVLHTYETAPYPLAGAWSGNGRVFAAGDDSAYATDISVFDAGSAAPRWVRDFGSTAALLQPRGLALSADGSRAWAVTRGVTGGLDLRVLEAPSSSATALTLGADPPSLFVGEQTSIGGWLAWGGVGVAGAALTVTRTATGAAPVALPSVTTRADGTFVFADSLAEPGEHTYTVTWAGDGTRAGVTATEQVTVHPLGRSLELQVQPRWNAPAEVLGYLRLRESSTSTPSPTTVQLTREVGGSTTVLEPVTTDEWGGAEFSDLPPAGTVVYTASVAADGVHPAATATATITVEGPKTLRLIAPAAAAAGSPVTLTGALRSGEAPVTGATVSVVRSGCSSDSWSGSATTGKDGAWTLVAGGPPAGTCTWTASYAGGGGYAPSTVTATTTVSLHATALTASAPASVEAGSTVTVRGGLTSAGATVAGAAVQVLRAGCSPGDWSGQAVTTVDGSWSVTDPAPPAGSCSYHASYNGDATRAGSTASASTAVVLRTTNLGITVVRGTGNTKKLAYVTGQLGAWHTNRTLTITAQPSNGAEVVLASGSVDATGKLTATYQPKTTTTYRVKYAGDGWYAAATASRTP